MHTDFPAKAIQETVCLTIENDVNVFTVMVNYWISGDCGMSGNHVTAMLS